MGIQTLLEMKLFKEIFIMKSQLSVLAALVFAMALATSASAATIPVSGGGTDVLSHTLATAWPATPLKLPTAGFTSKP